jgi:hypothetical protein
LTSIERTAFPFFRRLVSARELELLFTPDSGEVGWAREKVRSDEHLLALVLSLKCFQRLGYFPSVGETPEVATGHVRSCWGWGRAGACVRDGSHRAGCTGSWCAGGWGWFMIPSGHINNDPPKLAGDHRPISYQTLISAHPLLPEI